MASNSQNSVVLGYWNIRGLVNSIRLLLEHVGQKYEYQAVDGEKWFGGQKHSMGLPFPNLPYLIDGNTKLTQSRAILKYLARKHGLVATSEEEMQKQDMVDGVLLDIQNNWGRLVYASEDFEQEKQKFMKEKVDNFRGLDKWLSNQQYVTGNKLNFLDFALLEQLEGHAAAMPELLNQFPNLQKYRERMMNLKGVKEYLTSDRNPEDWNGPQAKWGAMKM
ncbi:hypothetical protein RvY_16447 [Ramazzottius varieornatus]|uniref:glutathione transferase n=1 Tax=Ramazzottius varieornatus TaxID=947166 RepID=A0A1D1VZB8_RAMVA|nr:hypothetical protein RvY_16447 [Ramazzottius varieornatus]